MKRRILGLAALAAFAMPMASASASPAVPVDAYPVWCGTTAIYTCGYCVEVSTYTNCTYW